MAGGRYLPSFPRPEPAPLSTHFEVLLGSPWWKHCYALAKDQACRGESSECTERHGPAKAARRRGGEAAARIAVCLPVSLHGP